MSADEIVSELPDLAVDDVWEALRFAAEAVRERGSPSAQMVAILVANLDAIADDLASGAVVVVGEDWLRVRPLPILPSR